MRKTFTRYLSLVCLQVLVPLLSNNQNHNGWPAVVSKDLLRHVHDLKSSVYVLTGQVKGRTLLPMPIGAEQFKDMMKQGARYSIVFFCCVLHMFTLLAWGDCLFWQLLTDRLLFYITTLLSKSPAAKSVKSAHRSLSYSKRRRLSF